MLELEFMHWAVKISKSPSDGQITEQRIHTYRFDDEKGQCFGLEECTDYKSSLQSTPRFTIFSTRKGHSQLIITDCPLGQSKDIPQP